MNEQIEREVAMDNQFETDFTPNEVERPAMEKHVGTILKAYTPSLRMTREGKCFMQQRLYVSYKGRQFFITRDLDSCDRQHAQRMSAYYTNLFLKAQNS